MIMSERKLKFDEFIIVTQSLLTRIDFLIDCMKNSEPDSKFYKVLQKDLAATQALYNKLTSTLTL